MMSGKTQLPRRSLRPSDAALRSAEAERSRPLEVRLADRRFTKWLLIALAALEFANGIMILIQDTQPDAQPVFSPWTMVPIRFVLSFAVYVFCYRGSRPAWWLAWARLALNPVAVGLSLWILVDGAPQGLDRATRVSFASTLAFGLVFLAFGVLLVAHPRVVAFRKDCRTRSPFA